MPPRAKLFVALTAAIGVGVLAAAMAHWQSHDSLRFACYLVLAVLASRLKVQLPGIDGTMSVNFLFVLLGILQLSLPETLIIGCSASVVQCLWRPRERPQLVKVAFNVFGMMANAVTISYFVYHQLASTLTQSAPLLLVVGACAYFLANTLPVSAVIALTEGASLTRIWRECYFWSFPYYLAGAALIGVIGVCSRYVGWESSILLLPVVYGIYRSYFLYLARLEEEKQRVEVEKRHVEAEKRHVEEISALQGRTIEALALAIEAKDHTTHRHLQRVQTYALEVAKVLGLPEEDIDALRTAALLHDIGKLAVPEHIINKPGRLTAEEFEKMKIHPVVGAEILKRVSFPYPVAPIVRSHHERWNGTGYPDGLKGEDIPIGARILAAVDCLDALATDRQYRKALPLDEAMNRIAKEGGVSLDPRVVCILQQGYREMERLSLSKSSINAESGARNEFFVDGDARPASGLEHNLSHHPTTTENDFLASIAAARQEAQALFELSQDLGNSLSLDETLSLVSLRLHKLIPYNAIAIFVRKGDVLTPEHVSGDNFRLLSSLEIPVGKGLCGWVSQNNKPIINGNPAVEPGYSLDPKNSTPLLSALAVPLEGVHAPLGVLALYRSEADAFTAEHLRVLQAITYKVSRSMENALKYHKAESSATTDFLTGLPNGRSLFMQLDQELTRCRRENSTLAVMVCDLDGFKHINDQYGHLEGDRVLKLFAEMIREVSREYDYVARMGGDEFVILAPGMTRDAADVKAALLNTMAQEAGRKICGRDLLSLSLGPAFYPQDGLDAEQLLAEADKRMYAVKQVHHQHP